MKKRFIGLIFILALVMGSVIIYAAPPRRFERGPDKFNGGYRPQIRENAQHIIHRTAMVIFEARRAAIQRHRFFGLARALAFQQRARELYFDGLYRDAIFLSLRAREMAIQIIRENHGRMRRDFERDEMEERFARDIPRDEELERHIDKRHIGRDDDAVHLKIELDI